MSGGGIEEEELREVRGRRRERVCGQDKESREGDTDIQIASDIFLVFGEVRNIRIMLYHCKLALCNWEFYIHKDIWLTI